MKSTVVFLCFLFATAAVSHQRKVPARSGESRKEGPLGDQTRALHRLYSRSFTTDYLTTDITVGTPPQKFTVAVDTGVPYLWVVSAEDPHIPAGRNAYNVNDSSTALLTDDLEIWIVSGEIELDVKRYYEQISIFGQPAFNGSFGAANAVFDEFTVDPLVLPFDGILGLSWFVGKDPAGPNASPVVNGLHGVTPRQFTVWMNATLSKGPDVTPSKLIIGGGDVEHCQTDVSSYQYVPLLLYLEFRMTVVLEEWYFGNRYERTAAFTTLDTGYSFIGMPDYAYRQVYQDLQPDYDWDREILTVPCAQVAKIPPFRFVLHYLAYDLPAEFFVVDIGLDDQCALTVALTDFNYYATPWILGTPFNRRYCLTYDLDNSNVLIALANGQS